MFQKEDTKLFEIDLVIKDSQGNPTNKRRSFSSDDASRIWEFWMRYQGKPKKRRRKTKAATAKEAEKLLKEIFQQETGEVSK